MASRMTYSVEEFAADVQRILETQGESAAAVKSIGPLMQRLARQRRGDLWQVGEHRIGSSGLPGRLLQRDPKGRFILALAQFPPNGVTPVHSHEGWGAICLLEGSERYTSWRRLDDGSGQGVRLEAVADHQMRPGDIAYWFNEPDNVHRQWPGERGCLEIVLLAGSGRRRLHFDLERGSAMAAPEMSQR